MKSILLCRLKVDIGLLHVFSISLLDFCEFLTFNWHHFVVQVTHQLFWLLKKQKCPNWSNILQFTSIPINLHFIMHITIQMLQVCGALKFYTIIYQSKNMFSLVDILCQHTCSFVSTYIFSLGSENNFGTEIFSFLEYLLMMGVSLVGIIDDWFAKPTDDRL